MQAHGPGENFYQDSKCIKITSFLSQQHRAQRETTLINKKERPYLKFKYMFIFMYVRMCRHTQYTLQQYFSHYKNQKCIILDPRQQ